jgi:small subunit ribosomal protein S17
MKKLKGTVVAKKQDKTVVVEVKRTKVHKIYKKRLTTTKKYLVHENKKVEVGQDVEIGETRPVSKKKCWKIVSIEK